MTKWGRSGGDAVLMDGLIDYGEVRIDLPEGRRQIAVQRPGADLEQ
jgi:hypothetical protein